MENLTPGIFIIPVFSIITVIILTRHFINNANDKRIFMRFVLLVFVFAFLLNSIWEILQAPLYRYFHFEIKHILICELAAIADAIMTLLLYYLFAFIYKNTFWPKNLSMGRIIAVISVGFLGSIISEVIYLKKGNWAYNEAMPIIPVVHVGLSPVLQFIILPLLIYAWSLHFIKTGEFKDRAPN
jgi:hypothetical protein